MRLHKRSPLNRIFDHPIVKHHSISTYSLAMQDPCACYNEYQSFRAWLDGMPVDPGLVGLQYGAKPTAMIVAAREDPPWAPAWILPKEPKMKQIEGFVCAMVLMVVLIKWHSIPWWLWPTPFVWAFKIWNKSSVENAVHNEMEKLRTEGRLLPKQAANPLYNIVPVPM